MQKYTKNINNNKFNKLKKLKFVINFKETQLEPDMG